MTEEEARTKWCPFVRVSGDGTEWHSNRPTHADAGSKPFDHCLGSQCAAWRWITERYTPAGADPLATRKPTRPTEHGFCGLAGAPQ